MSEFDQILEDDAALFADADGFPGVETFALIRAGKSSVSVTGPVFRDPPAIDPQDGIARRAVRVFVSSSFTSSIDCSADSIEIAYDRGGKVERHAIKDILQQDAGGWELLIG